MLMPEQLCLAADECTLFIAIIRMLMEYMLFFAAHQLVAVIALF